MIVAAITDSLLQADRYVLKGGSGNEQFIGRHPRFMRRVTPILEAGVSCETFEPASSGAPERSRTFMCRLVDCFENSLVEGRIQSRSQASPIILFPASSVCFPTIAIRHPKRMHITSNSFFVLSLPYRALLERVFMEGRIYRYTLSPKAAAIFPAPLPGWGRGGAYHARPHAQRTTPSGGDTLPSGGGLLGMHRHTSSMQRYAPIASHLPQIMGVIKQNTYFAC